MTDPSPRAALTSDDIPPGPFSEDDLREQWNARADKDEQWDSLDSSEQLAWAQARAITADRCARAALAAEPVGEGPSDEELDLLVIAIQALLPHQPDATTHDLASVDRGRRILRQSLARWGCPAALAAAYIDPEGEDADRQLLEVFCSQLGRGLEVDPETLLRGIRGVRAFRFTSCSSRLTPAEVQRIVEALDFCIGDSDHRANSGNHHRLRQRLKRLIATFPAPSDSGTPRPAAPPDHRGVLPMIITDTGASDECERERIICASISGGADYINNMPRMLTLERIELHKRSIYRRYIQEPTPPAPEVGDGRWSEGICGDGAAILCDGVMVPIEEVVRALNRTPPPAPPAPKPGEGGEVGEVGSEGPLSDFADGGMPLG